MDKEIEKKLNKLVDNLWQGNLQEYKKTYDELIKTDDKDLLVFLKSIVTMSTDEQISAITNYINSQKKQEKEEPKEEISRIFGIDISEIDHKRLDTGIEVFAFFDSNIGRKRLIENPKNSESLTTQLKEIQNADEYYQGEKDYKDNATSMLKTFPYELEMIDIVDINDYSSRIKGLQENEQKKLNKLLQNKDVNNIRYINLENSVALDKDGNLIESVIMENKLLPNSKEVRLESPKEYEYKVEEMSNENNDQQEINQDTISNVDQETTNEITFDDLEDIPDLVEAELSEKYDRKLSQEELNKIKQNIIKYYKNPDLMINLPEDEREFYEKFVGMLSNKIEAKKQSTQVNQMSYKPDDNKGFENIMLLSIILVVLAIVAIIFVGIYM